MRAEFVPLLEALDQLGHRLRGVALENLLRDLSVLNAWAAAPEATELPAHRGVFDVQGRTREFLTNVARRDAETRATADAIIKNAEGRLETVIDLAPGWFPIGALALARTAFSGALTVYEPGSEDAALHSALLDLWDRSFAATVQGSWPPRSADLVMLSQPSRVLERGFGGALGLVGERVASLVRPGGLLMLGASLAGLAGPEPWGQHFLPGPGGPWAVVVDRRSDQSGPTILMRRG